MSLRPIYIAALLLPAIGVAGIVALTSASAGQTLASAKSTPGPKAVLELFTSQGCSSCPPADKLLKSYTGRSDIIALSVPVDYWDRLGWKDTFASPAYSQRQRDYAVARGDGEVYTPQIVVNGATHALGSSAAAIDGAVKATRASLIDRHVALSLAIRDDSLIVRTGKGGKSRAATNAIVWLVPVQGVGKVKIGRGENGGRNLNYHNIALDMSPIATWTGAPLTVKLSSEKFVRKNSSSVVVLLQDGRGGPIIGASQVAVNPAGS